MPTREGEFRTTASTANAKSAESARNTRQALDTARDNRIDPDIQVRAADAARALLDTRDGGPHAQQ